MDHSVQFGGHRRVVASQVFSSSIAAATNVIASAAPDVTALSAAEVLAASAGAKIQIPASLAEITTTPNCGAAGRER
jgi:hypothetical protein